MTHAGFSNVDQYRSLREILAQIEVELKRLELWETKPPLSAALASSLPFCYDTLDLHEWLQWQLLPKMQRILLGHGALPAECGIFPYALDCFRDSDTDPNELLFLLRSFDEVLLGKEATSTPQ
jgi:uncharacterized protein YqcC (DUF446 family)